MSLSIETEATSVQKVGFSHSPTLENALFTFSRGWALIAKQRPVAVLVSIFSRRETRLTCFCSNRCTVSSRGSKELVRRLHSVTTSASPADTDALAAHYENEDFWLRSL